METLNPERVRARFPALARTHEGRPAVFFDGPAGSQVPARVAEAVTRYLLETNANGHGPFATSRESDEKLRQAHRAVADLLGTDDPATVAFGPNMTTLTLSFTRAVAQTLGPGDEVLVSQLEHDANYTPWALAARDSGATFRTIAATPEGTLDLADLERKLGDRTRWVAVTAASNCVGSLTPLPAIRERVHAAGARIFVDAVHYAPHLPLAVDDWGIDALSCSAYKFFGPHVGILWGKRELMESLPVYKLRPPGDGLPDRWMTGTQNLEGIAGTLETVEYLADLGREVAAATSRRAALLQAFAAIREHETALCRRAIEGLRSIPGCRVHGLQDPDRMGGRAPTIAFTGPASPARTAELLGSRGIFVWSGNFYALPLTEALGLEPDGVVRVGVLHYNTEEEVDRLLEAVELTRRA